MTDQVDLALIAGHCPAVPDIVLQKVRDLVGSKVYAFIMGKIPYRESLLFEARDKPVPDPGVAVPSVDQNDRAIRHAFRRIVPKHEMGFDQGNAGRIGR